MARRHVLILLWCSVLSGCASLASPELQSPISNEAQAIGLGAKTCYPSQTKRPDPNAAWHARLQDGYWRVWAEDNITSDPVLVNVDLPANGNSVRGCAACVWRMGWTNQEGPNHLAWGCHSPR